MSTTTLLSSPNEARALFDLPETAGRIVVAMSGGVDSSVVAALAAASGAEVIGITLQLYDYGAATGARALAVQETILPMRALWPIGWASRIMCSTMKARFAKTWLNNLPMNIWPGRTPVPCIRCNMGPKFTDLFKMARDLGADCLATGHYVRRTATPAGPQLHRRARSGT